MAALRNTGEELGHQLHDIGHAGDKDRNIGKLSLFQENIAIASERPPSVDSIASNNPFFDQDLEYTAKEEARVLHVLDRRLFPWVLLTTFVLNMDRTNNSNAISDNLPGDLGFTIDAVNTATAIYAVLFSLACLSGAIIAKWTGPARCKFMRFSVSPHDCI